MSFAQIAQALPPHSEEAEMALLAGMLYNNKSFDSVADFLRPEHFAVRVHAIVFDCAAKLIQAGREANPITINLALGSDADYTAAGGIKYLMSLYASPIPPSNVGDYGHSVHDLWLRRELMGVGADLAAAAASPDGDQTASAILEGTERRLHDLGESRTDEGPVSIADAMAGYMRQVERVHQAQGKIVGVPSGLTDLDRLLRGFAPEDLVYLAGRPSMGKTALGMDIAGGAERAGHRVLVFSLEMSKEALIGREVAKLIGIPADQQLKGPLTDYELERIVLAAQDVQQARIVIDARQELTLPQIRMRARRVKRRGGLGLVVIDHVGLIQPTDRRESRVNQISEISRGLKALAKELQVPVLALSQLNRAVEGRDDKRPSLHDLRDSGGLEQDADVVMLLYREAYYVEKQKPSESDAAKYADWQDKMTKCANLAEVLIAKHRNGPVGKVELCFDGPKTKFSGLARYGAER